MPDKIHACTTAEQATPANSRSPAREGSAVGIGCGDCSALSIRACRCGKEAKLRALKVSVNRARGVTHWLEHADGTRLCEGDYSSCAMKPYPLDENMKPWKQMIDRWNASLPNARGEPEGLSPKA